MYNVVCILFVIRDAMINQLRQQISELDLHIQEERINRKLEEKKVSLTNFRPFYIGELVLSQIHLRIRNGALGLLQAGKSLYV